MRPPCILSFAIVLTASTLAVAGSDTDLISIDFNNAGIPEQMIAGLGTKSGDYASPTGVNFTGQLGTWNALEVGTAVFDNVGRIYDERVMNDLTAGSGAATGTGFKLNLNGAGSATTANIGFDPMYGDAIVLDAGAYFHVPPTDDELRWAFEGLIPGSSYDLKFYSPGAFTDGFSINGDGLIPRDGDGNTLALSIIADVNGRIDGAFHHISPPLPVVYWAGVQIRGEFAPVPEPTSLLLFALGATALTRRRR